MFRKTIFAIIMILVLVSSGCVTTNPRFVVEVDSLSADNTKVQTHYMLLPGIEGVGKEDLQFIEFAKYINRALLENGFKAVDENERAEIVIFLSYGIGDPKSKSYSYSLPTYGQTGVSSSYTTGSVSSYGGYGTYSGTTTYTPSYGITGYTSHSDNYTHYFRFFTLEAIDLKDYMEEKKMTQVWKTKVTSSGSSSDLRRVFPIMVAASKEYIGTNTGKQVEVSLYETDPVVIEVKEFLAE